MRSAEIIEAAPEILSALEQITGVTKHSVEVYVPEMTTSRRDPIRGMLFIHRDERTLTPEETIGLYDSATQAGRFSEKGYGAYTLMVSLGALQKIAESDKSYGRIEQFKLSRKIRGLARSAIYGKMHNPPYPTMESINQEHHDALQIVKDLLWPNQQRQLDKIT